MNSVRELKIALNKFKKFDIFIICIGILSIIYFIGLLCFGPMAFSGFWLMVGIFFVSLGIIRNRISEETKIKFKVLRIIFYTVLIIGIIFFLILGSIIVYNGEISGEHNEVDCVIVLGAGLRGDKISLSLYERLKTATEYLKKNPSTKVVVSGGQGPDEHLSEAEAMRKFLMDEGIEENRIIEENKSINTSENFKFTRKKLDELGFKDYKRAMVVTNSFHVYRAKMLAKRNGFIPYGLPAATHPCLKPNFYAREVFAVVKSYIFD